MEICTPSVGPSPLFSTNMATPMPTSSPAALRALHFGVERVPADLGEQLVEQPDIVAAVVVNFLPQRFERTRIRHFVGADGVAPPDLDAVDVEFLRDRVDQPFAHERRLVAAGRAIGRRRRLVGQAEMADGAVGRHAIGPGQDAGRHVHDARRVGAHIGALIVEIAVVDGEDHAVAVDGGADLVQLLARVIGRDQMLAPVFDPFHRPVEFLGGDANQHVLRIKLAAGAEAAADMGLVNVDRARRKLKHARQQFLIAVRHLGGAVQFENAARGVVAADGAARLERHAGMPADGKLELDDVGGVAERRLDVAVALADQRRLAGMSGRKFDRRGARRRAAAAVPRSRPRPDRPRPRRRRDRRQTRRRSDRRHSAPGRSPEPAGGTDRAPGWRPRENRSAAPRRCRLRSTPRTRRGAPAPPPRRSPECGRARAPSARSAWSADAGN